jgi:hypothetical protein
MVFRLTSNRPISLYPATGRKEEEKGKGKDVGRGSAGRFVNGNPIKATRQIIDALQMR